MLAARICSRLYTMPDLSNLEALITRLAVIDFSQGSEQATREMAVNPVIGALGWDTFNPEEVAREYSVRGGRVDYCLRGQMSNLVLIEVKRSGTELGEHQEQLLRYAFDEGVPLAVLTDGLVWWLYLPMAGGSWEQRRFFRTNLREQHSGDAAAAIYRFLNREGLIGGEALEEAKREFKSQERDRLVRVALQEAWRQVLGDPQGLLRDLLAETVSEISGHVPDQGEITEFLQGVSARGSAEGESSVRPPPNKDYRSSEHDTEQSVPRIARKKKSKKKMSARVVGGHLSVKFADGQMERWKLPDRSDKEAIRSIRDFAVAFARDQEATLGQINAVKKALTEEGYHLTKPGSRHK